MIGVAILGLLIVVDESYGWIRKFWDVFVLMIILQIFQLF
jgi:hypothetical protein